MLIFSRTTFADGILPILPILFFVTKPDADPFNDVGNWPPSAGLSFALLPYLRSIYNAYYERVWGEHEKRWLKQIQPRAVTEAQEQNAAGAGNNGLDVDDGENMLEVNIDLGIMDDWDEEEGDEDAQPPPPPPPEEQEQAHPLNAPPLDAAPAVAQAEDAPGIPAVAPAPDVPRIRAPQPAQNPPGAHAAAAAAQPAPIADRGLNLAISTNKLFESVLGALAFPAVSAVMGEALRIILPKSWTSFRPSWFANKPTGLLQQKWGRSLVGGCMFVVLKDAVMLYVRWRMARDHQSRRVLDFKGKRAGKGRAAASS
jgi:hypothetical protein